MPTSTDPELTAPTRGSTASGPWSLRDINELDQEIFVARLGFLFEGSPWVAARAWPSRPWASREALHATLTRVVQTATRVEQLGLIRAHPDLAGRAALIGRLSPASTGEQRAAGLDPEALTPAEIDAFRVGNATYRERFGFPFVICARENRKEQILSSLDQRIRHDQTEEMAIALDEIGKIAWHRIADVVTAR